MNIEKETSRLNSFEWEGITQKVSFSETQEIAPGVECGVYNFDGDSSKDLGIIRIKPGSKTPSQKVLKGKRTIEGYVSGKGKLTITPNDGQNSINYQVGYNPKEKLAIDVKIGEVMQWQADKGSNLVAYEVCIPRYKPGRYENLQK